ncbi:MAG: hypothetical protein AAF558_13640 [Verrucomicrobiota bacterium]
MTPKRFGIFVGISLLIHLLVILLVATGLLKMFELETEPPPRNQTVRLTLVERPQVPEYQQQERPFVDTAESIKTEEPNQDAVFQGADNTVAMSQQSGSGPEALPNLTGEQADALNLRNTPYSPQIERQPSPPQEQQEPQEKQEEQEKQEATDAENAAPKNPLTKDPSGTLFTREAENERKRLLEEKRLQQQAQEAQQSRAPPMAFSAERRQSMLRGNAELGPVESFGAEQTELGRYKQKLYRAIGSRWYVYIEEARGFVAIGTVRIRFFVRHDGVFEKLEVITGSSTSQLYAVSRRSIMENSGQLEPFSETMRQQLGDGYWEEISFTIR